MIRIQDFGTVTNPTVYFENCGFSGNYTFRGNPGGSVLVVRNGGVASSQITFVNSTITACGAGASSVIGFSSANIRLDLINSTIKDNPVSGILCWEQSNATINIYNSVIENNVGSNMNDVRFSEKSGTALDSAKITVRNSLIGNPLWRNVPAAKIPYVKPAGYTVNNLFDAIDATNISFTPKSGSLAINYGDAQYLTALDIDYDQSNKVRLFIDDKCDAGAIETTKISTALEIEKSDDLKIYQSGQKLIVGSNKVTSVELITISGSVVKTSLTNQLSLTGINKGLYIVKVEASAKSYVQKLVVR